MREKREGKEDEEKEEHGMRHNSTHSFSDPPVGLVQGNVVTATLDDQIVLHGLLVLLQSGEKELHFGQESVLVDSEWEGED